MFVTTESSSCPSFASLVIVLIVLETEPRSSHGIYPQPLEFCRKCTERGSSLTGPNTSSFWNVEPPGYVFLIQVYMSSHVFVREWDTAKA